MTGLTPKQETFCQEYLIDLNATQAAIRAGYSEKTAQEQSSRLLSNVMVQGYVQQLMARREERTYISQDRVLKEYARLAFLDVRKLYDDDYNLKPVPELDDDTAAAISAIEVSVDKYRNNSDEDYEAETSTKKIKLIDKKGALDSVARHLGMFDKDTLNLNANLTLTEALAAADDPDTNEI